MDGGNNKKSISSALSSLENSSQGSQVNSFLILRIC